MPETFVNIVQKKLRNKYFRRRLVVYIILVIILLVIIVNGIKGIIASKKYDEQWKYEQLLFGELQERNAKITKFYTYGTSFGIEGTLDQVDQANFENVKVVLVDNELDEEEIPIEGTVENNVLSFRSAQINNTVLLDNMIAGRTYYLKLRLKTNNSVEPKYYMFENASKYPDIEYYTVTRNGKNNKIDISFEKCNTVDGKTYSCLYFKVQEAKLPDNVYDVVIDAGHGGKDDGYTAAGYTEADVCLEISDLIKQHLEKAGFKVAMTRDENNTDTFTKTNMYDDNGRISIACRSNAKYMLSIHITQGNSRMRGCEVYAPGRCNLNFARLLANKMVEGTNIDFSNDNDNQVFDGVYVNNYTPHLIQVAAESAENSGYEPYDITEDTPYIYSIREVGGIATGAYMDGRNTAYGKNKFYNSNKGIESYQINLGYIDKDLYNILNGKEDFAYAITDAFEEAFK